MRLQLSFFAGGRVLEEKVFDEDFYAYEDEDYAAKYGCLAFELFAGFFAKPEPARADEEGHNANDKRADDGFRGGIVCNGKAYGEGVDAGCNSLYYQRFHGEGDVVDFFVVGAFFGFKQHIDAYVAQQYQCYVRYEFLEGGEVFAYCVYAYPAN